VFDSDDFLCLNDASGKIDAIISKAHFNLLMRNGLTHTVRGRDGDETDLCDDGTIFFIAETKSCISTDISLSFKSNFLFVSI